MDGNTNKTSNFVENLIQPDPLCSPKLRPPAADLVKYVMVELDVPRDNHITFVQLMRPLVEIMFDLKRWELVFAAYPITGVMNRFVHIWCIPEESAIIDVMREGAQAGDDTSCGVTDDLPEEFRQVYQKVQSLITTTQHTLLTSLPYDPTHVGFQTHTVIIDTDGEKFSINHDTLRNAKDIEDIADDLEVLRRKAGRVRTTRSNQRQVHASKHSDVGKLKTGTEARAADLAAIQAHLNRGTSVARLKLDGGDSLLFNLAALKPKGVFQQLDPGFIDRELGEKPVKLEVDLPVKSVLLAAPWGAVYNLSAKDIQKLSVSLKDNDAVKEALDPLIASGVPLAAVPEERDSTVGDGCACFIINLKSFVRGEPKAAPSAT